MIKKIVVILFLTQSFSVYTIEDIVIENIKEVGDITQTDKKLKLPKDGLIQCGPVAVTNSLLRLSKIGYPNLIRNSKNDIDNLSEMINELTEYMNVLELGYCSTKNLISGTKKYINLSGYNSNIESYYLNYDLELLKEELKNNSSIFIVLRWFESINETKIKSPWTGHWITLVGYIGNNENQFILVNDPSPYAGNQSPNKFKIKEISGNLTDPSGRNYKGYLELEDFYKRDPNDRAIIIGAVVLNMSN